MGNVSVSVLVKAPQERVFEVFSDLGSAAANIEAIIKLELLTDGPVGKRTRFSETRVMFGKEHTEEMEITGFDPPNSYTTEAGSCGAHYTTVLSFVPEREATRVTMEFSSRPLTLMAKLMSPLGFLLKGTMARMMQADFDALKRVAESAVESAVESESESAVESAVESESEGAVE